MVCTAVKDEAGMVGGWKVQWNCWQVDKAGVGDKVQPLARSCGGDRKMKVLTLTTPQWTLPEASQVSSYPEARCTLVFPIMVHPKTLCSCGHTPSSSVLQFALAILMMMDSRRALRFGSVLLDFADPCNWGNIWESWPTQAAWQTVDKSWPFA